MGVSDDVELYDIPPAFQNRLLRWLEKTNAEIDIHVTEGKFSVYPRQDWGGHGEHTVTDKSLEVALNKVMGSRSTERHISKSFERRVRAWLEENKGRIILKAATDVGANEFVLTLSVPQASIETVDVDLEVALVLAEDELSLQTMGSGAPETEAETIAVPTRAASTRRLPDDEPETVAAPTRAASTRAARTRLFGGGDADRTMREAGLQENAKWSRAYIDSLPDSAFLHVESGGKKDKIGRSHPLSLRHLPYKNRSGRVDRAHLRAALSRVQQKKPKLSEHTKQQVTRHAQEIYRREFGDTDDLAANAPPRRGQSSLRGRELPTPRQITEREEARERREQRPFDPEAQREHYAKPHHFAVNAAVSPDVWRQIGGDMNPSQHGAVIARYDGDAIEIQEIQPVRSFVGDKEALDVGFPFWSRIGYYWPEDLDPSNKDVKSALRSWDLEPSTVPEEHRGLAIAEALLSYSSDEGPSGWAKDVLGDKQVVWWSSPEPKGWEYLSDEDDEFLELQAASGGARSGPARHEDKDVIREVMLGDSGYSLVMWDTNQTDRLGKSVLGYALYAPGDQEPLFQGEDYGVSPAHAIDSDESVRGLIGFLTLRPGDTDAEYFSGYSERQMKFAKGDAEELQLFGMDRDGEFEPPELVDVG